MKGKYTIRENGEVIGEADNLLTTAARTVILRYLAGSEQAWAGAIAVGSSSTEAKVTDRRLGFEINRGLVQSKFANMLTESIVVKAAIPRGVVGEIHELGLFSSENQTGRATDQMLITDFDPEFSQISNVEIVESRVGQRAAAIVLSDVETEKTARLTDVGVDISTMGNDDRVVFAYDAQGISQIEIRLINSNLNYLSYIFIPDEGYNTKTWRLNEFEVEGLGTSAQPFNEIAVIATGTPGGSIILDGLRGDDTDALDDQALVSRAVLELPIIKKSSVELEIEYSINFEF